MSSFVCPVELCLESLASNSDDEPYVRCVAVARGTPGLGIGAQGQISWCDNEQNLADIWVSRDGDLAISLCGGVCQIQVLRGRRKMDVTRGNPERLVDGDVVCIDGNSYRVHIYGLTSTITAPEQLTVQRTGLFVTEATMLALSTAG